MKVVDYKVRSIYYILLGSPGVRDSESSQYIRNMMTRVARVRGSRLLDKHGVRHTRTQDIVAEIIKDLEEASEAKGREIK